MRRRWKRSEIEKIAMWREQGVRYSEIARRLRASKSQIIGVAHHRGMCRPRRTREESGLKVNELCSRGKTIAEAAEELGLSYAYACTVGAEVRPCE